MAESTSDKETELTMCDVLEEEQELEDDANAVLGGSDDTNCSYDKGYVSRQALYACKTCVVTSEAGVCLACCLACHEGHEVVELYTKRNFRCDCGNSKFPSKKCSLKPVKDPINVKNKYNHNFKGLYCTCERPYPDPEDDTPDEMIQCIVCEDWYHGRHLGTPVPEDYFEMICQSCMASHTFLFSYLNGLHVDVEGDGKKSNLEISLNGSGESVQVPVKEEKIDPETLSVKVEPKSDVEKTACDEGSQPSAVEEECEVTVSVKVELEGSSENGTNSANGDSECKLKRLHSSPGEASSSAFWPENWRKELCRCAKCMEMYSQENCEFLLNTDDTIRAYEDNGKSKESQYDQGLSALSQLDRVKQMEAVRAYDNMKGELLEYLKDFANNKRTVCESDIKEFFDKMAKKKKMNNGVPHYCR